jgi:hypothetical protein
MAGGNAFTDFFTKTLKNGFVDFGNKIKDIAMSTPHLPPALESTLNFFRDKVNPGINSVFHKIGDAGIPLVSDVTKAFANNVGDNYLKLMPPKGGRRPRARGGRVRVVENLEHMPRVSGGARPKQRRCSFCGSVGAVKSTCPLNPHAAHRRHSRHPKARSV